MAMVPMILRIKHFRTAAAIALLTCSLNPTQASSLWPFEVVSPNGGEIYAVGDTLTATVNSQLSSSLCVLSINIGPYIFGFPGQATQFRPQSAPVHSFKIPAFFIETADTGKGPYLDSTSTVSDECAIQLADYSLPDNNDLSDSLFSIIAAPIVITASPIGPHSAGDHVTVGWRSADRIPGCTVELSTDNGQTWAAMSTQAIVRQSASWGNFTFVIPQGAGASVQCMVRVSSTDGTYSAISSGTSAVVNRPGRPGIFAGLQVSPAGRSLVLTVNTGDAFRLAIYDACGRLAYARRGMGSQTISVPHSGLSPGLRVVRCTFGSQTFSRIVMPGR
jgi:hypothetical protein